MNDYEVMFTEDGAKVVESNPLAIVASAMTVDEDWLKFYHYSDVAIWVSKRLVAYGRLAASPTLREAEEAESKFEVGPVKFIVTLKEKHHHTKQVRVEATKVVADDGGFVVFIDGEKGPVAAFNKNEVLGWEREPQARSIFKQGW